VSTEPAEHARYRGYLHALSQVSDADEPALLAEVLADPDRTVAEAAVIGHLDRRAAALDHGESFTAWSRRIAGVLHTRALPERRLQEWTLLKSIDAAHPWSTTDLIEASDWLQHRIAEHTASRQALTVLADQGRTKRIRNTAQASLGRPPA
jgi:hypothetical protein